MFNNFNIKKETLRFDQFFSKIHLIFRTDFEPASVKRIFKKICYNPDHQVEWSEVKKRQK